MSFKFLHTLWVYRLCICLLIYEIKIVTNILMGFKISCQVGGRGQKFQNYSRQVTFLFFDLKVHFLFSPPLGRPFFAKNRKKTNRDQKFENYSRQVTFLFFWSKSSLLLSKLSFYFVYSFKVRRSLWISKLVTNIHIAFKI